MCNNNSRHIQPPIKSLVSFVTPVQLRYRGQSLRSFSKQTWLAGGKDVSYKYGTYHRLWRHDIKRKWSYATNGLRWAFRLRLRRSTTSLEIPRAESSSTPSNFTSHWKWNWVRNVMLKWFYTFNFVIRLFKSIAPIIKTFVCLLF